MSPAPAGGIDRVTHRFWAAPYEIAVALFTIPATILFALNPDILASTAVDAALPFWWTNYVWLGLIVVGQVGVIYGWIYGKAGPFSRPGIACLGTAFAWYAFFLFTERPTRSLLIVGVLMAVGAVMAVRSARVG